MHLTLHIRESLSNLFVAKLRSFLAVLGVLIGTAAVVALLSGGKMATEHALTQFKSLGTDLLAVSIADTVGNKDDSRQELKLDDLRYIQTASSAIRCLAAYSDSYAPIVYTGQKLDGAVIGATAALADVVKIKLQQGRFISRLDQNASYCVIGQYIADKLAKYGVFHPIGKQLHLGENVFTIVGVMAKWPENNFMFVDLNQAVIIPIDARKLISNYAQINNLIFKLHDNAKIKQLESKAALAINKIVPGRRLFFRSAEEIVKRMTDQHKTFTWLLGFIGSISLLVGGIGVMNIMLVSVAERKREIGIRLAIGAKRSDIQLMFLIEAVVLTIFGGSIGIVTGVFVSWLIAKLAHWPFMFFVLPMIIGFVVSVLVGIFFGFYPAYKASHLDPITTLRAE